MRIRTCVSPEGRFVYGIHRPHFTVDNFRTGTPIADIGRFADQRGHRNSANFPTGPVHEPAAATVFEIPNAFAFRGTTYINRAWADRRAAHPENIRLPEAPEISFTSDCADGQSAAQAIGRLPRPLQMALAVTTTDARDLCCLAHLAGIFWMDPESQAPRGLAFERRDDGTIAPSIRDEALFEAVANNPHLPDAYKQAMVLRPGVQGMSEIVGEWCRDDPGSHVFEYLRRNSYIPWGHYAANMADDAVRYRLQDLTAQDMTGMRHLYYQRTYCRLAGRLGLAITDDRSTLNEEALEGLRTRIHRVVRTGAAIDFNRTLWGWNFGFDYAPSGYRLHASHQQIHQQYALIPASVPLATAAGSLAAYACGDLVNEVVKAFRQETGKSFFAAFHQAIMENRRMDGDRQGPQRLVVFEDGQVMLFVPKAQTSQWELQLMPKTAVGNVVEAGTDLRRALDRGLWTAVRVLGAMGARMISTIEYSKPVGDPTDQRLLYAFLPKLPDSPGAFSEAQLRWINGHYPEDFALACRRHLPTAAS